MFWFFFLKRISQKLVVHGNFGYQKWKSSLLNFEKQYYIQHLKQIIWIQIWFTKVRYCLFPFLKQKKDIFLFCISLCNIVIFIHHPHISWNIKQYLKTISRLLFILEILWHYLSNKQPRYKLLYQNNRISGKRTGITYYHTCCPIHLLYLLFHLDKIYKQVYWLSHLFSNSSSLLFTWMQYTYRYTDYHTCLLNLLPYLLFYLNSIYIQYTKNTWQLYISHSSDINR